VTYGSTYGSLATTSRTGYLFNGWWTGPNGSGTEITSGTTVAITSNQTLYAYWIGYQYTVTFDAQGGSTPVPTSKQVTYGSTYGSLATTSRTGYLFNGWWTGPNGSGTEITSGTTVAITSNQTLYADWTMLYYTADIATYKDTYVVTGTGSPSVSSARLEVGVYYNPFKYTNRSFIAFNLPASIPSGVIISSASLAIQINTVDGSGFNVKIERVTDAWNWSTSLGNYTGHDPTQVISWNNQPYTTGTNSVTYSVSSNMAGSPTSWSVLALIQDEWANGTTNNGVLLWSQSEAVNSNGRAVMGSLEGGQPAHLIVQYHY
jgi:uncharacterized repeat protein (TIGR02543 family)